MLRVIQNIISFLLLIFVQILILNNIQFLGFISPYIYLLFILSLPVRTPQWLSLILAFLIGQSIDVFSNTGGIHTAATVFIAFIRPTVIKLFIQIDEGNNPTPSFNSFGIVIYLKYLILLVVTHHTILFFLEAFSFSHFWIVLLKTLISSTVSILIILGIRSLFNK